MTPRWFHGSSWLAALLAPALLWAAGAAGGFAVAGDKPQTQTAPARESDHPHSHDATATHSFEDVERWRAVFDSPERAAWQKPDRIPGELGLEPGMVVADLGAGTGYFIRFFSAAVGPSGKVYAVDLQPEMVAHLAERARREETPNVIPTLARADDAKLPAGSVDVVFICDTWHHIGDRVAYLKRLAGALKPGGRIAVVDFQKRELPVGPPVSHKLSREQVIEEFAEAGWALARESTILPYQYFLIFKLP